MDQKAAWDAQWNALHPGEGPRPEGYHGEGGGGGGFGGAPNYLDIAKQIMGLQQEANKPVIESLQASIPETQAKFAQQKTQIQGEFAPLEQRYQGLLAEITRNQKAEESRTGIATSRELGRRGISSESGLFDQTVNERLSPVTQFYTGQATQAGLGREESIRQLQNLLAQIPVQETDAIRQIQNSIAQLQAGGNAAAIQSAQGIYGQQLQAQQAAAQNAIAQQNANLAAQLQNSQLAYQNQVNPLQLQLLQAQVNKVNQPSGGGGSNILQQLQGIFG